MEAAQNYYDVEALSASGMKKLLKCPALFKAGMNEKSQAMDVGSLFHAMILEPDEVSKRFKRKEFSGSTKAGKEEALQAQEAGLTLIRAADWDNCSWMAKRIAACPETQVFFNSFGENEKEYYFEKNVNGMPVPCKAKVDRDVVVDGMRIHLDVKTTTDASPAAITKAIIKYGYHIQASWYLEASKACDENPAQAFVFIFVEKKYPHLVTSVMLNPEYMRLGNEQCERALHIYADCLKTKQYPGYADTILVLEPPAWLSHTRDYVVDLDDDSDEAEGEQPSF